MIANEIASYSMMRNSCIVRDRSPSLSALPYLTSLFLESWIFNPWSNRCQYTPVESKLNVEFSRFTSASSSKGRERRGFSSSAFSCSWPPSSSWLPSISNANSRRNRGEEDAEQSVRGLARENKSRYQRISQRREDDVVGYLNQCYHGVSLNQPGIKVITAPIKWNRGWGWMTRHGHQRGRDSRSARQTDLVRKNG